jgi:hypothetical protein
MSKLLLSVALGLASLGGLASGVRADEHSRSAQTIERGQAPVWVYRDYYAGSYDQANTNKISWQAQGLTCELVQYANGWYVRVWTYE